MDAAGLDAGFHVAARKRPVILVLAVLANVCYCAAYIANIPLQYFVVSRTDS